MTAAVGFPTLRLVRWSVGKISLADQNGNPAKPGDVWEVTAKDAQRFYL
jgi:23S rRNA pseudouridine2457 synthase